MIEFLVLSIILGPLYVHPCVLAGRTLTWECHSWWQVGLVVHLFSATHFTYNKRKAIKKSPLTTGLLALTGTVLLVRPTRPFLPLPMTSFIHPIQ